jgi:hypothetical protein
MKIPTSSRWAGVAPWLVSAVAAAVVLLPTQASASGGAGLPVARYSGLTAGQRADLLGIARDTWKFYGADVDPGTHLPLDNLTFAGGSAVPTGYGRYTSAANIGVYLWAVVAAKDLGLISRPRSRDLIEATLNEVQHLKRFDGFLYQWYDTTTGDVIRNPGDIDCSAETAPAFDNCYFVSNVDNGVVASWLVTAVLLVVGRRRLRGHRSPTSAGTGLRTGLTMGGQVGGRSRVRTWEDSRRRFTDGYRCQLPGLVIWAFSRSPGSYA